MIKKQKMLKKLKNVAQNALQCAIKNNNMALKTRHKKKYKYSIKTRHDRNNKRVKDH